MVILVTNDDGVHARGLKVLVEALQSIRTEDGIPRHTVYVVAPDDERSGVSHSMTLQRPARVRKLSDYRYSCSGTPADCVIISGLWLLDNKPDLVISGINDGPNLGNDIVYSGTCGAARQAAFGGIPAIAVSCASYGPNIDYRGCASFVAAHLDGLRSLWKAETFVNVNGPSSDRNDLVALWAHPGNNSYSDTLTKIERKNGDIYFILGEGTQSRPNDEASDHEIVTRGYISVGLIGIHPVSAHDPSLDGTPVF